MRRKPKAHASDIQVEHMTKVVEVATADMRKQHDLRVQELLDANNDYLERARSAESEAAHWKRKFTQLAARIVEAGLS